MPLGEKTKLLWENPEYRLKMSQSHIGYKMPDTQKIKISESNKGKIRTLEMREKYRKSKIGNKNGAGNKGRKYTPETLKKMSESKKGKHYNPKGEFKKGQVAPMKGRKRPDNTGEKNNKWKGGISKLKGYSNIYKRRYRARKYNAEGTHTFGEWELLKKQYGYTCVNPECRKKEPEIKLTEDHIIPLDKGGSDYIENIQPLCKSCNSKKHTKIIKYVT